MTTSNLPTTKSHSETHLFLTKALIIAQGVVTLFTCLIIFPLGIALVLTNTILTISTRGTNRKLFAGFAITGAAICIIIALGLVAVSTSGSVEPPAVKVR